MKQLYTYIAILTLGLATFCSCVEDEMICTFAESGNDVTLKLSVSSEIRKEIVNSRATNEENKLYDLHFYVFNTQGKLTGYEKFVSATGDIIPPDANGNVPTDADGNTQLQSVNIRTKTGTSYIYALANINSGSTYKLDLSDADIRKLNVTDYATNTKTSKEEVNALRTAVEDSDLNMEFFLGIKYKRTLPTGNEVLSPTPIDNKFMMSGYLNDGNAVTIQKNGNSVIVTENDYVIKLYRILAKIRCISIHLQMVQLKNLDLLPNLIDCIMYQLEDNSYRMRRLVLLILLLIIQQVI